MDAATIIALIKWCVAHPSNPNPQWLDYLCMWHLYAITPESLKLEMMTPTDDNPDPDVPSCSTICGPPPQLVLAKPSTSSPPPIWMTLRPTRWPRPTMTTVPTPSLRRRPQLATTLSPRPRWPDPEVTDLPSTTNIGTPPMNIFKCSLWIHSNVLYEFIQMLCVNSFKCFVLIHLNALCEFIQILCVNSFKCSLWIHSNALHEFI
jgi:hypothetical protein